MYHNLFHKHNIKHNTTLYFNDMIFFHLNNQIYKVVGVVLIRLSVQFLEIYVKNLIIVIIDIIMSILSKM